MIFPCKNSEVEYEGLGKGLKLVIKWKIKEIHVYGDS